MPLIMTCTWSKSRCRTSKLITNLQMFFFNASGKLSLFIQSSLCPWGSWKSSSRLSHHNTTCCQRQLLHHFALVNSQVISIKILNIVNSVRLQLSHRPFPLTSKACLGSLSWGILLCDYMANQLSLQVLTSFRKLKTDFNLLTVIRVA